MGFGAGMGGVSRALARGRWLREMLHRASMPAEAPARGRALLSYLSAPIGVPEAALPVNHTQYWEAAEIARLLAAAGFRTDVMHYHNRWWRPRGSYDVLVDVRWNMERLAPLVGPSCVKIFHADTADAAVLAAAEQRRLDDLERRRGVRLEPRRLERGNRGVEVADAATILGNQATLDTYRYAGVPLYGLPVASALVRPFDEAKEHHRTRGRFLWLGSRGMVHKGLDLVLEAFAAAPDLHLTVCGPVHDESDFVEAYRAELFATANIDVLGFVDVTSSAFADLAARTSALIYPSSSEGCAGSVVTAMHAGLVPIVSRESGVDVEDAGGLVLQDSSPAEVAERLRVAATWTGDEIGDRSRAAWERANARYTRAAFTAGYGAALHAILDRAGGT